MAEYTPSLNDDRGTYVIGAWEADGTPEAEAIQDWERMIEAVRAEERERAVRIAESLRFAPGYHIAARIRAQGKEQGT